MKYFLFLILPVAIVSATIYFYFTEKTTFEFKAQISADTVMTKEEMEVDLNYLVETLKDVHPKTLNGFSEEQTKIIKNAYEKIQNPMTAGEFYFVLNEIMCSLKDAHTNIWLETTNEDKIIDLPIVWLKDGIYVIKDTDILKKGDKVVSIGGKTDSDLLKDFEKIIPAENMQWVKVLGIHNITKEPFLKYLNLKDNGYVNVVLERNNKEIVLKLPLINQPESEKQNNNIWVSYTIDTENSLGIFKLDKCIYDDVYKKTLEEFFVEVSKNNIKNVAVDLRKNTGGNSRVINEFMRYIDVDKYFFCTVDIRYSKQASEQRGYIRKSGYKSYSNRTIVNKKVSKKELIYNGNLYVLTSSYTFSSANWFAVVIRDNNLGIIIGEPTGNQPTSYGDILRFQLPVSGFKFNVSHKNFIRPNLDNDPEDSLYPDIEVYTTIEDILNERDPQIEELIKIVKEKQKL